MSGADFIIGIDLAGPSNTADTALAMFRRTAGGLRCVASAIDVGDAAIADVVARAAREGPVAVGLDAPLSYNPGGGYRPSDRALQRVIVTKGLRAGSIMAPTFNRMAYLTLRGLALSRWLGGLPGAIGIVEVHPGAALALGGAPVAHVRAFKTSRASCARLVRWLEGQGMSGIPKGTVDACHSVAACAAALGAWKWTDGRSEWRHAAAPPAHPFDFAC